MWSLVEMALSCHSAGGYLVAAASADGFRMYLHCWSRSTQVDSYELSNIWHEPSSFPVATWMPSAMHPARHVPEARAKKTLCGVCFSFSLTNIVDVSGGITKKKQKHRNVYQNLLLCQRIMHTRECCLLFATNQWWFGIEYASALPSQGENK